MMPLVDELNPIDNTCIQVNASGSDHQDDVRTQKSTTAMKRTKKQPMNLMAKATKTSPPVSASMTMMNPGFYSDLLLYEKDNAGVNLIAVDDVGINDNHDANNEWERQVSYVLGEKQDRVVNVTPNKITISSALEPHKTVSFDANRWAHFIAVMVNVDDEAKELNRKTRPVVYRQHLGDGYYVSVTGGIMCIDFRKYFLPYGLPSDQVRNLLETRRMVRPTSDDSDYTHQLSRVRNC